MTKKQAKQSSMPGAAGKPVSRVVRIREEEWAAKARGEGGPRVIAVEESFDLAQWIVTKAS